MRSSNKPFRVIISEKVSNLPEEYSDISFIYQPDLWQCPEKLSQYIHDADGLIVRNQTRVDAALLSKAENLQVIGRLGAGLDNIDIQSAHAAGVQVVYAPNANTISVAEYCLGQIFNILRIFPKAMRSTSSGEWLRTQFTGRELSETVIGLVGFGKIAQALAERLQHLGGNVVIATRSPKKVPESFGTVLLDELLKQADIVSLHVSGGLKTLHLIGSLQFKAMKPTAWLLNTARGSVVDEEALYAALFSGEIAGAVVDVRKNEPPAVGALEALPNFYATPHIAAFTSAAQERVNQLVFADVAKVLRGCCPTSLALS
ncbi:MAG: NAD(P)-binding domain-containing protein [Anaerolineae bacterium]|jgi:D-3-phosphoglycerate dehydrogenase|nr:NAD(P)-binding domain-containing protein [Anaerolineae bacterium]MBT5466681.1 NAD(P)-binding domain-containing protein [Candidatus Neomarinimicrobiota bacterium]MBT3712703.1 NAD(P)-binding domain-containing protein [Anaerolineae bacterium]MBT4311602.1 NAD(P)-binding domain-containing protein [Anaerolineae bacterium]MBT4457808.1 NAD(P)-binding domain-containing protein [Anaerolineae bacterium]